MRAIEFKQIKEHFNNYKVINESEFIKYFFECFPERSKKFYNNYLTDLYKNNVLYRYDTDLLKLSNEKKEFIFNNSIDDELKNKLESIEPVIDISIWRLSDLNRFMSLQPFLNIIFVETYYYAIDVIVNLLMDCGKKVVIEDDYDTYVKYNRVDELYVIRKINEDSPINRRNSLHNVDEKKTNIVFPKIEKVIVDIIVDDIFNTILSDETYRILCELLKKYKINMATIKRYATKKHALGGVMFAIKSTGFNIETGEF